MIRLRVVPEIVCQTGPTASGYGTASEEILGITGCAGADVAVEGGSRAERT